MPTRSGGGGAKSLAAVVPKRPVITPSSSSSWKSMLQRTSEEVAAGGASPGNRHTNGSSRRPSGGEVEVGPSPKQKTMSPLVASIFTFNLIIGAGCLTMPKSFAGAGVLPSTLLLLFLMAMGYTTATFMVEAMALSNYILKTDEDGNAIDEGQQVDSSGEEDGEVDEIDGHGDSSRRGHRGKLGREPRHRFTRVGSFDGSDARRSRQLDEPQRLFEIDIKVEMSSMAEIFLSPGLSLFFYVVVIGYLFGDLAIYLVACGKSLRDLMCSPAASATVAAASASNTTISGDEAITWAYSTTVSAGNEEAVCIGGFTREGAYLVCIAGFLCLTGPWVFFDISNLGFVQMFATVVRYTGLGVLIAVSFIQYLAGDGVVIDEESGNNTDLLYAYYEAPAPAPFPDGEDAVELAEESIESLVATLRSLQALFGVSLYSFMCHHSLPSIVTPVLDPKHRVATVFLFGTYLAVLSIYLLMGVGATLRFPNPADIQDLYTLNFAGMKPRFVGTFLVLFPVIVMMTSFPIIGISLRENLCELVRRIRNTCCKSTSSASRAQSPRSPRSPVDSNTAPKSPAARAAAAMAKDRAAPPDRRLRVAMAVTVLVPTVAVAVSTENVGLIVAVTGSLFGALIQVCNVGILLIST
eukprot:INCI16331.10.p1 GENE.INCI16331.10~~INCI16331.10.p1  ORF type:complete len:637 (+),score=108.54 INCI16331.10:130-2040(+)